MKKTVAIVISSLIVVVVISVVINQLVVDNNMTKDYQQVNQTAVIVESKDAIIDASPSKVFSTLTNVAEWSKWNSSVNGAAIDDDFASGTKFKWNTESGTINSQIKVVEKDKKVVWVGKTLGIFAIHTWTFQEADGKTKVTSSESWEGLTAVALQSSLRSELADSLQIMLRDLKSASEEKG
ncbi:MAG: hypothetical protein EOO18_11220 [Chryseobacterium sp.]|nr:MAG: hypothetical protein EOO18_11220 [Chryseobacterium sp.]